MKHDNHNKPYPKLTLYSVKCDECTKWLADLWVPEERIYPSIYDFLGKNSIGEHDCVEHA